MLLLALALPLFQQLDDGLLHPLGRIAPGEIFAQGVAGEGDLVQVTFQCNIDGSAIRKCMGSSS